MPAKRLILFPQDKGGIGKSFVATLMHDHLVDAGVRVKAFDLDHANSTFYRLVPCTEFINTDVDADKLGVLDRLVHVLPESDVVLVDNRASGGGKVLAYLDETRLPDLQEDFDCALVFVVIATDDKDANSQIAELLDSHGGRVRWLVVRNLRDGDRLEMFDQSQARRRLAELHAIEITVPCLAEVTRNRLQSANLTVGRGRQAEALHLLDRSRCVRFHENMAEEFGRARDLLHP
ncbi:MAG TPA: division plane positioning ATPase MipZ [Opitutaceae bacterium]|nr:division plane positioning ATPase MipZ [Opitutaceae bacterium]HRJ46256.1 division plane positioning ATPase MipZ [Opitutaceae bacterium]